MSKTVQLLFTPLVLEVIFECCEKILTRKITRVKIRLLGVCSKR